MSEWDGKVALVTGGTRGIGRAIAAALANVGVDVTLTGRDPAGAAEAASALSRETARPVSGIAMNVASREAVDTAVKSLLQARGRIDILVNNAGITRDNLLMRMKPEEWESVIATNVNGLYYCSQAVLRPMIRGRAGRIINMSSVVGLTGNPGQANYAASKAAILGFTKALAREVASRQITVNAIAPGYIETDMTREIPEDARKLLFGAIPMQRIGRPEDVASAALYLASEAAGYVTGQVLQVNGGLYM
ncbi:MAG TPA: 3-oxoacyl-ACP reductase FabG [Vicinamibacteria bacterium]|nr:3-oxoacyl-ACP reductase FabG [Vicinamibacteria bacterium]